MPSNYDFPFIRLTWGGTFDGEEEIWSNNLSLVPDGNFPVYWDDATVSPQIIAAVNAWHTSDGAGISNRCKLAWIKIANIRTDGTYGDEPFIYDFPTPVSGGSIGSIETTRSLAVSFKTQFARGKAANGRFYIPAFNENVSTNGRLATATQENVLEAAVLFIDAINAALEPAIAGSARVGVTANAEVAPRHAVATTVRVGDVIDSQRRRKNKMLENYVSDVLAA